MQEVNDKRTKMSKYEFEYDSWFRDDIPKAQYGSLQCWIENEKTQPWTNAYDMTIHSLMYEIAVKNGLLAEQYGSQHNTR